MYRANLYGSNIPIPIHGSVKDTILMEQHFRDKMTRKENYETLFLVAVKALAHQVDKEAIDMFSKLINRVTGVAWMESSEGAVKSKKEQDLDILAKIKNLDHRIK